MSDADDLALVSRFWDALYSRDWPLVRSCFDDRSQYWDVPVGPQAAAVGPADIEARLLLGLEPLAGYSHVVSARLASGGVVVTEHAETWEWHTGESVTLPFVSMMRVRDGVIGRWVDYWNMPTLIDASPAWWQERLASSDLAWVTDLSGAI